MFFLDSLLGPSSLAHRSGKIDWSNLNAEKTYSKSGSYSQSKLANLLFTSELNRRLSKAGSSTIAVAAHPGWTITNLQVHTKIFTFLNPFFEQLPKDGCLPSIHAATHDQVHGGEYFGPSGFLELKGSAKKVSMIPRAKDADHCKQLWTVSEKLTDVNYLNA